MRQAVCGASSQWLHRYTPISPSLCCGIHTNPNRLHSDHTHSALTLRCVFFGEPITACVSGRAQHRGPAGYSRLVRGGVGNTSGIRAPRCRLTLKLVPAVTDLRKPVAATPPQEIMCLCVWPRRFLVLPGTTLPEPPLSLVILARCLAGNQPSGPLREEGGGDVSLLGMRPLYFSDIQQEQQLASPLGDGVVEPFWLQKEFLPLGCGVAPVPFSPCSWS
ncbi:unnamed protein product [Pleuronectes platessa]|uniref:Uncharacterized protein n=1 Tax=Pleuronectes platessa TaxID=8262 RepID=A0A9N7UB23_PLEPL|nr:unnamed protein product [Pleuronectes platessa]